MSQHHGLARRNQGLTLGQTLTLPLKFVMALCNQHFLRGHETTSKSTDYQVLLVKLEKIC